jgi:rare lipoprotein A
MAERLAALWRVAPLLAAAGLLGACSAAPGSSGGGGLAAVGHYRAGRPNYKVGAPYEVKGVWYYPKVNYDYDKTGIASWYGGEFNGQYTANGEIYDLNKLTAAHTTLPLPSIVEVTNLQNGRSLRLRVNDRGPFADGRIIDVSRRAAQLLGFEVAGTAPVRVQVLREPSIEVAEAAMHNSYGTETRFAEAPPPVVPVSVAPAPIAPAPVRLASAAPPAAAYPAPVYAGATETAPAYSAPAYAAPTSGGAAYAAPAYNPPAYAASSYPAPAPASSSPAYGASSSAAPSYSPPAYASSASNAPAYQAPAYQAPTYAAPTSSAAADAAPAYRPPAYAASSYPAPTLSPPAYAASSYAAPSYSPPAYAAPTYGAQGYQAPAYAAATSRQPPSAAPAYRAANDSAPVYRAPLYAASAERISAEPRPAYREQEPVDRPVQAQPGVALFRTLGSELPAHERGHSTQHIFVQCGAFARAANAEDLRSRIAPLGAAQVETVSVRGAPLYRVRLGPVSSVAAADHLLSRVVNSGYPGARIVFD